MGDLFQQILDVPRPDTVRLEEGPRRKTIAEWAATLGTGQLVPPVGMMLCPECGGASWVGPADDPQPCGSCLLGVVQESQCARCQGLGYLRATGDINAKGFGKLKECPDCKKGRAIHGAPSFTAGFTFDSFRALDLEGKGDALETAVLFARLWDRFMEETGHPGLLLRGQPGRGKTGLAAAIANRMRLLHVDVRWIAWAPWLAELKRTFDSDDPRDPYWHIGEAVKTDLLIVDDLGGQFAAASAWRSEMAQQLFDARGFQPIVLTTMLDDEEIGAQFGEHVLSRIRGLCQEMVVGGADLRVRP